MRKYLVLALLIAGLACFAPLAGAVSPDPDNAAGIDLHSNTVVNGLVIGVSDTTSGNTVQVGPVGGIYEGSASTYSGNRNSTGGGAQAYTGAAVLVDVAYTPAVADGTLEIYDGTSRGDHTDVLLDIQGGVAKVTVFWRGAREVDTGILARCDSGVFQLGYRIEDQGE